MTTTLITGATGFLGREIARSLLLADRDTRLLALVRASDAPALEQRRRKLLADLPVLETVRVTVLRGEVAEPSLGLDERSWTRLAETVDRVVHVAATTRFDLPLAEARRQNVSGTAEVLRLCRELRARGASGRLDHVSTAYVAGDRRGLVGEEELEAGQSFRNTYERSKYEAEQLCRCARDEVPVVVHRPSIIVGHARTGETRSFKALYWPLKILVRFYGLAPGPLLRLVPLPLHRHCSIDLVPVDWVANAVVALYQSPDVVGRCFHLAAGPDARTVAELAELCGQHFGVEPPRFTDPDGAMAMLGRAARPLASLVAPRFVRQVEAYQPYTVENPRFDVTNARGALPAPPPVATYFSRLLGFAHATDFGRRPAGSVDDVRSVLSERRAS